MLFLYKTSKLPVAKKEKTLDPGSSLTSTSKLLFTNTSLILKW